ncbi:MAG: WD40 repeat domain-containing protein [Bacteroidales bacterium]|nr:WD40 repeat domain-containing protein [Bacteroidales bacterium]
MIRVFVVISLLQLLLMPLFGQNLRLGLPEGHTSYVNTAEFSSDGKYIVTASDDGTAKIWESRSGKLVLILVGHTDKVTQAHFSPDGKSIVTASFDNTVKIWESSSGKLLMSIDGHTSAVWSAQYSSDGKYIITDSQDGTKGIWESSSGRLIRRIECASSFKASQFSPDGKYWVTACDTSAYLYDTGNGELLQTFQGHSSYVLTACFSPDGKQIVTASWDNTVKLWDCSNGKLLHTYEGICNRIESSEFSPDGKYILATTDCTDAAIIWDVQSGAQIKVLGGFTAFYSSNYSPDGKYIVSVTYDRSTVEVWESSSGNLLHTSEGKFDNVNSVRFSPDGEKIVIAGDVKAEIWSCSSGKLLHNLEGKTVNVYSAQFSPDSKTIITTADDRTAKIWELSSGKLIFNLIGHSDVVNSSEFSPDAKYIATASKDETAKIWESNSGKLVFSLNEHENWVTNAQFSPDGKYIATVDRDEKAKIWESSNGNLLCTLMHSDVNSSQEPSVQFSSDNKRIVIAYGATTAEIRETGSWKLLADLVGDDRMYSAQFSPNGIFIVTAGADTTRVWESSSGKFLFTLVMKTDIVKSAKFSPDGKYIVTIDDTCINYGEPSSVTAKVWDSKNGKFLYTMGAASSAQFSPDGKFIITATPDYTAKIWESSSGKLLRILEGHSDIILSAQFSKDGKYILTSSRDAKCKLWHASTGIEIASLITINKNGWIVVTPDKYYYGSKDAVSELCWSDGFKIYPFEQFDLKYNRPDIVLARLGYASQELIDAYYQAYLKRLKKMGFTEEKLSDEFHIPETAIENFEYMPEIDEKDIEIDLNFNDSKYKLDRYNIWINDVPLFGMTGKSLSVGNFQSFKTKEHIELNEGDNKIQVSCLNEKGVESYKETVEITYTPKTSEKHDLYFVAVSVSEYEDSQFNLKYAVKDGRDMVKLFSENRKGDFANIYIDTLFNSAATTDNLIAVKQKLMNSQVDDEVILYISGHGLLDDNLDFYFASHNVDFSNPAINGISYDVLEGLLDGIPARKKLLLMDACHSGEVDKEDTQQETDTVVLLAGGQNGKLKESSNRSAMMNYSIKQNRIGLQNSFDLMQEMFANLNRGSGAVVISAAAGVGKAIEGEQWNNGVFTYALLDGLYNLRADANGDKQVSLSEIRSYVIVEVDRLTNGRQRPTCRQENLEFDWRVW